MNNMRERISSAIQSLPQEIAVHGTTQSRGDSILATGLNQQINYFNIIRTSSENNPKQEL